MTIYLDMDGTIADLYGEKNWLEDIINRNTRPYENAKKLIEEKVLENYVNLGFNLGIISWLAKDGTKEYNKAVRKAKKEWLKKNYPNIKFTEIHIVKYGTDKSKTAKEKNGILIDDEERNRKNWKGLAIDAIEIR